MTYDELKLRCHRIMGLSPDATESIADCMKYLDSYVGVSRWMTAEHLARELAEYVEALPRVIPASGEQLSYNDEEQRWEKP